MVLRGGGGGLEAGLEHLRAKPKRRSLLDIQLDEEPDTDFYGSPEDAPVEEKAKTDDPPAPTTACALDCALDSNMLPGGNFIPRSTVPHPFASLSPVSLWTDVAGPDENNYSELAMMRKAPLRLPPSPLGRGKPR